jgi:hypothetical protein
MHSLFNLVIWVILAPFRIIKFIVSDVIVFGIVGGIFSLIKAVVKTVFRIIFNPFTLLLLVGGAVAFSFAKEEQKKRVKALMGM